MGCRNCGREGGSGDNWQCQQCFNDDLDLTSVGHETSQRIADGIAEGSFDIYGEVVEEPDMLPYTPEMEPYIRRKF